MDRESIETFWRDNYLVLPETLGLVCPSPEEVFGEFRRRTGNSQIQLEKFKEMTCGLGMGIRLNKKRRKNQTRFYNVALKTETVSDTSNAMFDSDQGVAAKRRKIVMDKNPSSPELTDIQSEMPDDAITSDNDSGRENIQQKNAELLNDYMEHQSSMNVDKKTIAALTDASRYQAPSTRKQMFGILKSKGLYQKFPAKKFTKFNKWLQSPSGGELERPEEIVSEVNRYLYFCTPKKVMWEKLFDTMCFNNYLIVTKDAGLGPDGTKTKIERLITALKYLRHRKKKLTKKCDRAIAEYKQWLRPLGKKKKVKRMQNSWRDELFGFSLTMEDIDTAVPEQTIKDFSTFMEKAMGKDKLSAKEYRVIVDTLITLTITQESAIRPGAFQFMTLKELSKPLLYISPSDGAIYNIVFVLHHKTFATHGPLAVPFSETVWVHLHNYLTYVRPQVEPKAPFKHLVFLNAKGKMIEQPGKSITKVTKHHVKKITPTKIRHCIATVGAEKLTDKERRAVASGIGHTMQVHNTVYTDLTIRAVQSSIEAQKKLHDKSKCNKLPAE